MNELQKNEFLECGYDELTRPVCAAAERFGGRGRK